MGKRIQVYLCPYCKQYHITTQTPADNHQPRENEQKRETND